MMIILKIKEKNSDPFLKLLLVTDLEGHLLLYSEELVEVSTQRLLM